MANKQLRHTAKEIDDGLDKLTQIGREVGELVNPQDFSSDFNNDFGGTTAMELAGIALDKANEADNRAEFKKALNDTKSALQKSINNVNSALQKSINNVNSELQESINNVNSELQESINEVGNLANDLVNQAAYANNWLKYIEEFIVQKHEDYQHYNPLQIIALEDTYIQIADPSVNIYCSSDGETWDKIEGKKDINAGGKYYLYGENDTLSKNNKSLIIWGNGKFEMSGNIMMLLSKLGNKPLSEYCFCGLFKESAIVKAPELPATTLAEHCYDHMFFYCFSLVTAPELPATTLAEHCYSFMFYYCDRLVTAPELPATTLVNYCYWHMFRDCHRLVTAPELPATTLAEHCYDHMFYNCDRLNSITIHATNISATKCLDSWLLDASPTGTFTKKQGVQYPSGSSGIPNNWTVVEIE